MSRLDERAQAALRTVRITRSYLKYAEGSVLIEMGDTKVLCAATVEHGVPPWLRSQETQHGWVSAEYDMLPRSCTERITRDRKRGAISGRSQEIQRLIGRSLRAVTQLDALGEHTIWLDCDVIQGDGGTRTAAITGAYVALADAVKGLQEAGAVGGDVLADHVAAVSVGIVGGELCLDLNYEEDARADVDLNVVMTGDGQFVEVQGTAEREPFSEDTLSKLLQLARQGIGELVTCQQQALGLISV